MKPIFDLTAVELEALVSQPVTEKCSRVLHEFDEWLAARALRLQFSYDDLPRLNDAFRGYFAETRRRYVAMRDGGFALGDPRAHAAAELHGAFADFSRNGRWGTCAQCPCDGYGRKLPECCSFTDRDDHQLDIDELAKRFKEEVASFKTTQEPSR